MSREKQIEEMDLSVLNCFRNRYYTEGISTERGIIANAINNILPTLVSLKSGEYCKKNTGEWITEDLATPKCSACGSFNDYKDRFCPNCGAEMKGGEG